MFEDKKLNKLAQKMAKMYEEDPTNADALMEILDDIAIRQEELGETWEENDKFFTELLK